MRQAIGIDIGGTNTKLALICESSEVIKSSRFPTASHLPIEDFLATLKDHVSELIKDADNIIGIGIGCPNIDARSGKLVNPPNLKWGEIPLGPMVSELFDLPIFLSNDANIAAFGEKFWGEAQEMDDFIVVTLGTGVGTGIYVNNQIVLGVTGLAGEGGHINVEIDGRKCGCGSNGHLECYASVRGIKETVKELTDRDFKFREIAESYKNREPIFVEAFDRTAKYLAYGLAQMAALLEPEAFILAGGIATIGEDFRDKVEMYLKQIIYRPFQDKVKVLTSSIATEHGAVLGAASLVFHSE